MKVVDGQVIPDLEENRSKEIAKYREKVGEYSEIAAPEDFMDGLKEINAGNGFIALTADYTNDNLPYELINNAVDLSEYAVNLFWRVKDEKGEYKWAYSSTGLPVLQQTDSGSLVELSQRTARNRQITEQWENYRDEFNEEDGTSTAPMPTEELETIPEYIPEGLRDFVTRFSMKYGRRFRVFQDIIPDMFASIHLSPNKANCNYFVSGAELLHLVDAYPVETPVSLTGYLFEHLLVEHGIEIDTFDFDNIPSIPMPGQLVLQGFDE